MTELILQTDSLGQTWLQTPTARYRCAIGRNGLTNDKKEGDGCTPTGTYPLRMVLYRPDEGVAPQTALPVDVIAPDDGWCDASDDPAYNQKVKLPYAASHEKLWRDDELYNIIVMVGYNDDPPIADKGSAIFLHIRKKEDNGGYGPTAGCLSFTPGDLRMLLRECGPDTRLHIPRPEDLRFPVKKSKHTIVNDGLKPV